ncbi:MAG: helix-turn-helix domain-containing protein [Bacilli bacterium]|jgi:IS30 family transposase|nr:helix-turn-helix domain-containing protein [Bacilli bacterium]
MENEHDGKHMTSQMRETILRMIKAGAKLEDIAAAIGKDPRTVSKEVKARRQTAFNERSRFHEPGYEESKLEPCKRLVRFPYVCDGCPDRRYCSREKKVNYVPSDAQSSYEATLVGSRRGVDMTEGQFRALDEAVSKGTKAGLSICAIALTDPRAAIRSQRELYRMVENGWLSVKKHDLRMAVSYKPRKKEYAYKSAIKDPATMEGRRIEDYWRMLSTDPSALPAQMDTVIGSRASRKCILTLHFPAFHLMLLRLLREKTAEETVRALDGIKEAAGPELFRRLFPAILSDRGPEFYDASGIEGFPGTGEAVTSLFYCDAYCSNQKGAIESNHRMLRYCCPKGTDFDLLTDDYVAKCESAIASYPRRELGGRTPYDVFEAYYGEEALKKLGIEKADPRKIGLLMSGKKGKK